MRINVWTGDDEENHRRNRKKNIYMAITCCCYIKYWSATKRLYDMPEIDVKDNINTYASSSYSQRRSSCRFCSKKKEKKIWKEKRTEYSQFSVCSFQRESENGCKQKRAMNDRSLYPMAVLSSFSSVSLHEISIPGYVLRNASISMMTMKMSGYVWCRIRCAAKQFNCSHASHKLMHTRTSANNSDRRGFLIYRSKFSL